MLFRNQELFAKYQRLAAEEKGVTFVGEYMLKLYKKTRKKKNKAEKERERSLVRSK
jgi:hypothetical protein